MCSGCSLKASLAVTPKEASWSREQRDCQPGSGGVGGLQGSLSCQRGSQVGGDGFTDRLIVRTAPVYVNDE